MPAPHEIVGAPLTLYVADVGASFPALLTTPGGSWTKIGTNGDLNYMDDGVEFEHPLATKSFRPLGDPGPIKEFIDSEDLIVRVTVVDLKLETYSQALNQNTVTTVAAGVGTAGYKWMGLSRGIILNEFALLIRGLRASPYGDDFVAQYQIPRVVQVGQPKPVYRRADPVGLQFEFKALVDPAASTPAERFGRLVQQHEEAGT